MSNVRADKLQTAIKIHNQAYEHLKKRVHVRDYENDSVRASKSSLIQMLSYEDEPLSPLASMPINDSPVHLPNRKKKTTNHL